MSASPTRLEVPLQSMPAPILNSATEAAAAETGFPLEHGNRVLESIANQHALPALLAFSALHGQITLATGEPGAAIANLIQTERFVLDEVLQLFCDRALATTKADGVIVALAEGSSFICRAGSGALSVGRGVHLVPDSEFLQESLDAGRIFCCDDCQIDTRLELDISSMLGARSTALVPLRGPRTILGVLQAFASEPFAFSDDDIRSLDLFGELLLSALKPGDQDRRVNWLAGVADAILAPREAHWNEDDGPGRKASNSVEADTPTTNITYPAPEPATESDSDAPAVVSALESAKPFEQMPAGIVGSVTTELGHFPELEQGTRPTGRAPFTFVPSKTTRPGLHGVMALVAVAALFSAGVWWGMQAHTGVSRNTAASNVTPVNKGTASVAPTTVSDHLLDPTKSLGDMGTTAPLNSTQLAVLPKITSVRHWSSSIGSTVVIDMEDQVPYEVHRLTSPERIYFDLHDTALVPDLAGKSIDVSDSALTRVRVAQPVPGVTRIVLDTRNGSNFSVSMESNPYRLIVELRDGSKGESFAAKTPAPGNRQSQTALLSPTPRQMYVPAKGAIQHFRIVLDAGHGGWDLGTVGRDGLLEKDLVLDVAQRLGTLLKNRLGAEVVFTRASDDYLALDQRAQIANESQADLFVSVHANYSNSEAARGIETYYTNFFSAPGSREMEKRETGTSLLPTPVALSSSELREKIGESRRLAASVQHSLFSTLALHSPGIRDRGVKDSNFVVLTGTTMPAILTEISFVSSPADERNLRTETYRQQIAEALYTGISSYEAASRRRIKMAQVQAPSAQR